MVRAIKRSKQNKPSIKGESSSAAKNKKKSGPAPARVWQPGVDPIEEGEELQYDPSAYHSLHAFHLGWPCLSFDIISDSLGLIRTLFPHTAYLVAGTQASQPSLNSVQIVKLSNISGKRRDLSLDVADMEDSDSEGSDSEGSDSDTDDEDGDDVGGSRLPKLQSRRVAHQGCVNRVRAMPQKSHICATWGDTGFVQVWDMSSHIKVLEETDATWSGTRVYNQAPLDAFNHREEGYPVDWSPVEEGRLVTGDCNGCIHLWEPTSGAKWTGDSNKPFVGHRASVEDLQWSPSEGYEFASCSVDGTIVIWDTRQGRTPGLWFKAHKADVNVISWSRKFNFLMASGSDDGTVSVHDLRVVSKKQMKSRESAGKAARLLRYEYHKHPITSIECDPNDDSGGTVAVSSADNQLTIWDTSVERDEEEEAQTGVKAPENLPCQLQFVHQGQKELKELHWHPQIPGMIISTASDGFNILMPCNL